MLYALAAPVAKIFLLIALGVILKKTNIVDGDLQKGLSRLVVEVFSPAMALAAANQDFSGDMSQGLLQAAVISAIYFAAAILAGRFISRKLPLQDPEKRAFSVAVVFTNSVFIGLPVALELLGGEGMIYVLIFNVYYRLLIFTYGIWVMGGVRQSLGKTLLRPAAIATFVSIGVLVSPFRFPAVLQDTFQAVGGCLTPAALIMIGYSIATVSFKKILTDKYAYMISAMTLAVFPLVSLGLLKLFNVGYVVGAAMMICISMPCAAMLVGLSEQYECAPGLISRAVVQSTLLMLVSLPVMLSLTQLVLG